MNLLAMVFKGSIQVDDDVVDKCEDKVIQILSEEMIDVLLESGRGTGQPKRHD